MQYRPKMVEFDGLRYTDLRSYYKKMHFTPTTTTDASPPGILRTKHLKSWVRVENFTPLDHLDRSELTVKDITIERPTMRPADVKFTASRNIKDYVKKLMEQNQSMEDGKFRAPVKGLLEDDVYKSDLSIKYKPTNRGTMRPPNAGLEVQRGINDFVKKLTAQNERDKYDDVSISESTTTDVLNERATMRPSNVESAVQSNIKESVKKLTKQDKSGERATLRPSDMKSEAERKAREYADKLIWLLSNVTTPNRNMADQSSSREIFKKIRKESSNKRDTTTIRLAEFWKHSKNKFGTSDTTEIVIGQTKATTDTPRLQLRPQLSVKDTVMWRTVEALKTTPMSMATTVPDKRGLALNILQKKLISIHNATIAVSEDRKGTPPMKEYLKKLNWVLSQRQNLDASTENETVFV